MTAPSLRPSHTSPRTAGLLLAASIVIGSVAFTLVKLALEELSPMSLACGRVVASAALFVAIVLRQPSRRIPVRRDDRIRMLLCGLGSSAGFHVLFNLGQQRVSVAMASVVMATFPVLTAVGEVVFLRHSIRPVQVGGLALTTLGCTAIGLAGGDAGGSSLVGLGLIALATLTWAAVTVATREMATRYDSWWLYTPGTLLGALVMLVADAPHLHEFGDLSVRGWLIVVWLGTASSAFIYFAFARVMTVISATTTTSLSTVVTPTSVLVAWLVLGDAPSAVVVFGGLVVVGGALLVTRGMTAYEGSNVPAATATSTATGPLNAATE